MVLCTDGPYCMYVKLNRKGAFCPMFLGSRTASPCGRKSNVLAITAICNTIREECKFMFYALNTFELQRGEQGFRLGKFLSHIGVENMLALRSVVVNTGRFGSGGWADGFIIPSKIDDVREDLERNMAYCSPDCSFRFVAKLCNTRAPFWEHPFNLDIDLRNLEASDDSESQRLREHRERFWQ